MTKDEALYKLAQSAADNNFYINSKGEGSEGIIYIAVGGEFNSLCEYKDIFGGTIDYRYIKEHPYEWCIRDQACNDLLREIEPLLWKAGPVAIRKIPHSEDARWRWRNREKNLNP